MDVRPADAGSTCQVRVGRSYGRTDSLERCGAAAALILENWAGRSEAVCPAHAEAFLADLRAAITAYRGPLHPGEIP